MTTILAADRMLARSLHGRVIPHWSHEWTMIGRLSRLHLVRVVALSRWSAEIVCAMKEEAGLGAHVGCRDQGMVEPQSSTAVARGEN